MPVDILMPALSPTMTEGNLVRWLKKEGDPVEIGEVLAEIETDKATMEVEAIEEGTLGKIYIPEGTSNVKVNTLIAHLLEDGEDVSAIKASAPAEKSEKKEDASVPAKEEDLSASMATAPQPQENIAIKKAIKEESTKKERLKSSPLARRIASQNQIDLSDLEGSGPRGRIVKKDVEAAREGTAVTEVTQEAPTNAKAASSGLPERTAMPRSPLELEKIPVSGMRKVIAERLTQSKQDVPHFYLTVSCQLDELLRARQRMNARLAEQGVKVSVNDFVIKASAMALKTVPDANVSWDGDHILRYPTADVAVAVSVEGGLYTPLIREAEHKSLAEISVEMKALAAKARSGKLTPEEYQGGSFSLSNLGMYGVDQFQAIINPPQACILAVGAGKQEIVAIDGAPAVRTMMSATLSVDHRAVDGALGAQWLQAFKTFIEDPIQMLG